MKFVYKSTLKPRLEKSIDESKEKIKDFKDEISLIETKLKLAEKYTEEKKDLLRKLNELESSEGFTNRYENFSQSNEILKLKNDIKLKDAQINTAIRENPQLQLDKNVIQNKIAREEYNKKQYETQLEEEEKIIKGEEEKDCECEPHEIIYFKGDKCEKTHSNYNRPLPPGFQVMGALFFMDVVDLIELGYWARNA